MIQRIADRFWTFFETAVSWKLFAAMVCSAVLLRIHTVFIDFIHVDVLTTFVIVKDELAGRSFSINKGALYHYLMKFSIEHMWDSPTSFHFIGVLFVVATCVSIFILGYLLYNARTGLLAGTLYGCIISSFNHGFLATNGEVVYNLFFVLSFIFYYLAVYMKKYIYLVPLAASVYAACQVKFQGIYVAGILVCYTLFILPYALIESNRRRKFYYGIILAGSILLTIILSVDWNYTGLLFSETLKAKILSNYSYVAAKGLNPVVLLSKLLLRIWLFGLYHSIIWVPGIIGIIRYFRKSNSVQSYRFIVWITLMLFAAAFTGGVRLYNHYFIPVLAPLSVIASAEIFRMLESAGNRRRLFIIFVVPVFFWFGWNMRDLVMLKWKPEWKHTEGNGMYLFRSVFINSLGEYLLPGQALQPAIDYLRQTPADSSIFVWPMGTEVVYFSKRHSSISRYWLNERASFALVEREKGNDSIITEVEQDIINNIKTTSPDYFVDTSGTVMVRKSLVYKKRTDPPYYLDLKSVPIIRFGSYGNLSDFPQIIDFLNANYVFQGNYGDVRIWKKFR